MSIPLGKLLCPRPCLRHTHIHAAHHTHDAHTNTHPHTHKSTPTASYTHRLCASRCVALWGSCPCPSRRPCRIRSCGSPWHSERLYSSGSGSACRFGLFRPLLPAYVMSLTAPHLLNAAEERLSSLEPSGSSQRRLKVQRTKKHTLALSVFGSLALAVLFALFLAFFNLCFSFIVTVQKSLDAKIHSKKNAGKHNHNNNNTAISCAIEKSVSEKQASVRCEFFLRLKRTSAQCDRSQSAKKYARTHQMENPLKLSGKLIVAGKINVKLKRNLWK